jgi:hypothetical protein
MIPHPILIEDVVPIEYQEHLKDVIFNKKHAASFPWFYRGDMSSTCEDVCAAEYADVPGLVHLFYNETGQIGSFIDLMAPVINNGCNIVGFKAKDILFARMFLQFPTANNKRLTIPHVDVRAKEHLVMIYYVIDADGDTVFFNRLHDYNTQEKDPTVLTENDIVKRVTPKQGNLLVFPGNIYHAAMLPEHHMRCIANINLVEDI